MDRVNTSNCHLLQHRDSALQLSAEQFDIDYWTAKPGHQVLDGGRGATIRISLDGQDAILRRYYRGGMVGNILTDEYLWLGKSLSRPWREWKILQRAHKAGLPVPAPIAACVCRTGLWYRAAIITAYLNGTQTLAAYLSKMSLNAKAWYRLGAIIKQMQAEGICHPDLTVTNILIDEQEQFYVIDFDNARIKSRIDDWQWRPLYRLQRSLDKFNREGKPNYREDDWQALMDGYQA